MYMALVSMISLDLRFEVRLVRRPNCIGLGLFEASAAGEGEVAPVPDNWCFMVV